MEHAHDGRAADAFAARLDNLLPRQFISINQFARDKRMMVNPGGEPFPYDPDLTPYAEGINDALDHPEVRTVSVKGNTRSAKTVSAENMVLRNLNYGGDENVIWLMQDKDSLNDYIDERGEEMLMIHPEVDERIDWSDPRNSRTRKRVGKALVLWRSATIRALRAKSAPIFVADEIDAYDRRVRDAIKILIDSRQEEYGNASKSYICSHPDAGPEGGIDAILRDSTLHLWFVRCPKCGGAASPAREVEDWELPRLAWNVPELMSEAENMERTDFLDFVADNTVLICPYEGCGHITHPDDGNPDDPRLKLMNSGRWLQRHQRWLPNGKVEGDPVVNSSMGFVIHGFMAPFVKVRETARDWASASLTAQVGSDVAFREVVVKKLGETPQSAKAEEQIDSVKVVQARLTSAYMMKSVPEGVLFLTAFVDVQGDRFEVRVVGWDIQMQSWLIDAYSMKQWPVDARRARGAFDNIDPASRIDDWDIIEETVITASYPLQSNPQRLEAGLPELFLPVVKTVVNNAGVPGVTNNGRVWLGNMLSRAEGRKIESYRVMLMQGNRSKTADTYGKPKQVVFDDSGKALPTPVYERYPNVHDIKKIVAKRMKIDTPGQGRMHLPIDLPLRYVAELTAERMIDGDWVQIRARNETWDGWVACDVARDALQPNRANLWEDANGNPRRPPWATPKPRGQGLETVVSAPGSPFDRLAELNRGTKL